MRARSSRVVLLALLLGCAPEGTEGPDASPASGLAAQLDRAVEEAPAGRGALDALAWPARIRLERELAERDEDYQPVVVDGGVALAQPAGPSALVGSRGAALTLGGAGEVRIAVASVGRPGVVAALRDARPQIAGAEVRRALSPGVTEFWRALPSGLEHGVTLDERPAGQGVLRIEVQVSGLEPRAIDAGGVALVRPGDEVRVATYAHLLVIDADGARLPARMTVVDGAVRIDVDDASARYPLVVDPLVVMGEATLLASGGAAGDYFGWSVALSADGSRALVGGWRRVRVLVRSGTSWTEEATLLASGGAAGDYFGWSVALSADGGRALVGAVQDDTTGGVDAGSARVFVRSGTSWTEEAILVALDGAAFDFFGTSVALSADGSRALVGAHLDDTAGGVNAGSARVFVRSGSSWSEEAVLLGFDGATLDYLGGSVALSADGSRALVGAAGDDTAGGEGAGSARAFTRSGTTWTEEATLLASDGAAGDAFGVAVALSADGSRALVGAAGDDTASGTDAGSARVFARSGSSWTEEATLLASSGAESDNFGRGLALTPDGVRALVGAPHGAGEGVAAPGAVFERRGTSWTEEAILFGSGGAPDDYFGLSVALSADGSRALVGVPGDDTTGGLNAGSARVFTLYECGDGAVDGMEQCDEGAANGTAGSCCTATCAYQAAATSCRPAAGACDVAEACTGDAGACPPDGFAPDGTACADGRICDGDEVCLAGTCAAGAALDCSDDDVCTVDLCGEPGGCTNVSIPGCCDADADCDDADACTRDRCDTSTATCTADPIAGCCATDADCGDGDACTTDTCDTSTSSCFNEAIDGCRSDAGARSDAGVDGAVPMDGGGAETSGGCGCRTAHAGPPSALWLLALGAVLLRQRRRT